MHSLYLVLKLTFLNSIEPSYTSLIGFSGLFIEGCSSSISTILLADDIDIGNITEIKHTHVKSSLKSAGPEHACKSRHAWGVPVSDIDGSQIAESKHPAHIGDFRRVERDDVGKRSC